MFPGLTKTHIHCRDCFICYETDIYQFYLNKVTFFRKKKEHILLQGEIILMNKNACRIH